MCQAFDMTPRTFYEFLISYNCIEHPCCKALEENYKFPFHPLAFFLTGSRHSFRIAVGWVNLTFHCATGPRALLISLQTQHGAYLAWPQQLLRPRAQTPGSESSVHETFHEEAKARNEMCSAP